MKIQKQRRQAMCHVTSTARALHLAFLGTQHLKLGLKVYTTYYTLT